MSYKILLINPWIYDFAAYNFWARPLGILKVAEFLSLFNVSLQLIDCCNSFKIKKFGTGKYSSEVVKKPDILKNIPRKFKKYGISEEQFIGKLKQIGQIDIILVTSIMAYWWLGVKRVVEILRDFYPNTPIILGGIYATLYKEHAEKNIGADFVYEGQADIRLIQCLDNFGIHLKRIREKPIYWWQMGFYKELPYAPILTSTGCPFRCAYCASSLLYNGFQQSNVEDVIEEITGLYRLGVKDFAFYDDALLYESKSHIKPILWEIIRQDLKIRFHTPNGLHARFVDKEIARLMKLAGFKTLRLSLETVDIKRQIATGGKVTNEELEKAVYNLRESGFSSQEIGVYIMYGLPEQTIDEVWAGAEFLKKLKVRIHLTEFSPIRGTFYWQKLIEKGVITDDLDPLLTNNTVFSEIFCYPREEIEKLKNDVNNYNMQL
ncbi:B12-binding domain-containing radical SAM protein [Thermodesulfovibrio hydrogeniphilus]